MEELNQQRDVDSRRCLNERRFTSTSAREARITKTNTGVLVEEDSVRVPSRRQRRVELPAMRFPNGVEMQTTINDCQCDLCWNRWERVREFLDGVGQAQWR